MDIKQEPDSEDSNSQDDGDSALDAFGSQTMLYQLKIFLSMLVKFGLDISTTIGDHVKRIVFNLVVR